MITSVGLHWPHGNEKGHVLIKTEIMKFIGEVFNFKFWKYDFLFLFMCETGITMNARYSFYQAINIETIFKFRREKRGVISLTSMCVGVCSHIW